MVGEAIIGKGEKKKSAMTRLGWATKLYGESRSASGTLSEVVSDDQRPWCEAVGGKQVFERLGHSNSALGKDGVAKRAFGRARMVVCPLMT